MLQWTVSFSMVHLQLCVSFLLLLLQLATIPVFLVYSDLRKRILYRIMLSIALSDFLQLLAIFLFTLFQFLGHNYSEFMEKFASGVYIIAWDHLIIQHFLLALNRLIIILRACYSPAGSYKTGQSRLEQAVFNFLLLLSWLLLLALLCLFLTPYCGGKWLPDVVGFYYNTSLVCSDVFKNVELYFTLIFPATSLSFYVIIICLLKKSRAIGHQNSGQAQSRLTLNGQEKRILLLSVLLFSLITALIFSWYKDYSYPPWTLLFCGYLLFNTILSLTMNSEYRQRFQHMWRTIFQCILCQPLAGINTDITVVADPKNGSKWNNNNNGQPMQTLFIRKVNVGPRSEPLG